MKAHEAISREHDFHRWQVRHLDVGQVEPPPSGLRREAIPPAKVYVTFHVHPRDAALMVDAVAHGRLYLATLPEGLPDDPLIAALESGT